MDKKRVLLLGANGFTASLISELISKEDLILTAAGRDINRLNELYINDDISRLEISLDSEELIINAIKHSDIIINCIGPFNLYGNRILKHVVQNNVIYIDISGEQQFINDSFNKYDGLAKSNKATIIHSVSYESYLAELIADKIIDSDKAYRDISTFYYTRGKVSSGTRLTMRLNPFYKSYIFTDNHMAIAKPYEYNKKVSFSLMPDITNASFVPFPEVLFFCKIYKTKNAGSYSLVSDFDVNLFHDNDETDIGSISDIVLEESKRKRVHFSINEREKQSFFLIVNSIDLEGSQKNICVKGRDTYGLTAYLVKEFILELLKLEKLPFGVFSPGSIIKGEQFLKKIQEEMKFEFADAQFYVKEDI